MHQNPTSGIRLIKSHGEHLGAHGPGEAEALLIGDLPILSGTELDQKGMDGADDLPHRN